MPASHSFILDDSDSVYMFLNGSAKPNTSLLDAQQLAPSEGNAPPSGAADVTNSFKINQTDTTVWVVDGSPYKEASTPVIFGNASEGWNADTTLHMPSNATIDIIMNIAEDTKDMVSFSGEAPSSPPLVAKLSPTKKNGD